MGSRWTRRTSSAPGRPWRRGWGGSAGALAGDLRHRAGLGPALRGGRCSESPVLRGPLRRLRVPGDENQPRARPGPHDEAARERTREQITRESGEGPGRVARRRPPARNIRILLADGARSRRHSRRRDHRPANDDGARWRGPDDPAYDTRMNHVTPPLVAACLALAAANISPGFAPAQPMTLTPRIIAVDKVKCAELLAGPNERTDRILLYYNGYVDGMRRQQRGMNAPRASASSAPSATARRTPPRRFFPPLPGPHGDEQR